jgi:hypothetical protein
MTTLETAFLIYVCVAFVGFAATLWHAEKSWKA